MSNFKIKSLAQVQIPVRARLLLRLSRPFLWLGGIGHKLDQCAMDIPPTVSERAAMKCHCRGCLEYIRASAVAGRWLL